MKAVFAGSFAVRLVEPVRRRLTMPCEIVAGDEAAVVDQLGDADVLVSMAFTKQFASAGAKLRLVQVPGAGLDRIDRSQLRAGLTLANAYGHEAGIAEYVMGAMIALTRDFQRIDQKLRAGQWESQWSVDAPAPPLWPELAGKTLGILGFGHIGEALARRAHAFDMKVCAIRRQAQADVPRELMFVGGPERLDELLALSDYLAITLSLSPETRDLLDAGRLALLKPQAYLINVARAEIVNEQALYDALAGGRLAGAALDVWYRYPIASGVTPPSTAPFHELGNVIMTPHVSGWTEGMLESRAGLIAENIERTARGEPPLNAVAAAN
ncbi:2-hydroxyacid dehydrogenase [Bradyrhizobium ivorense]|uniref:2-hydroxyacid dehydrogenase n=1 Tax=Bradyrhizobium ivorense TaxID=2511166 RepID=UPI0010B71A3C|nr:2-hydroxyacid dehydrogenase [Bradyrhizobium ivorense]VIO75434.1 Hydroxypyruvate reductase [Bradyrhizobium ivorense]